MATVIMIEFLGLSGNIPKLTVKNWYGGSTNWDKRLFPDNLKYGKYNEARIIAKGNRYAGFDGGDTNLCIIATPEMIEG